MASLSNLDFVLRPKQGALVRAGRITLATLMALLIAMLLGIDSPFWAGMTVLLVAQPTRGQLLGKGLARVAGTLVGALASVGMMHLAQLDPWLFIPALALWISTSAVAANLLSGFHVYAALLAGYTAALVALPTLSHPDDINSMALSRVASILVGVGCSLLFSWLWSPRLETAGLRQRAGAVSDETMRLIAAVLCGDWDRQARMDTEARLGLELAALDAECDQGGSGASSLRRERRRIRHLLLALFDVLAVAREVGASPLSAEQRGTPPADLAGAPQLIGWLDDWRRQRLFEGRPWMYPRLARLQQALRRFDAERRRLQTEVEAPTSRREVSLHRDWIDALRTGVRTLLVLLSLGAGWLATGEPLFLYAMMGAAIISTVFSTMEMPKQVVLKAAIGTFAGSVAALICKLGLMPWVDSIPMLLLALAPFLMIGCLAMAERDKVIIGTDFGAVFLLLTAPDWPLQVDAMAFLHLVPGPTLGALTAAAGFYFILPTGPQRRLRDIEKLIEQDLRRLSQPGRRLSGDKWRTRALHRTLRLVLRNSAVGVSGRRPVYGAIMALNLGSNLLALNRQLRDLPQEDIYRRTISESLQGFADERLSFDQAGDRLLSLAVEVVHQPGRAELADLLQRCGLVMQAVPWR
ncbi:hypothetical protein GCM10011348_39050 [Marinobacterium nitratireducens]|uniref:FUSC family protein n=1 Tax=Marinobacterium nitratireducens TaxID=518897 RepID=A0A917ZMW7_9GAMM|nr:FUSC family protein [Marinobacterium nitratireducens]GGO86955.1 hypothetical protein GCM10011348_39050 [Marinobacterium nitratireducens]